MLQSLDIKLRGYFMEQSQINEILKHQKDFLSAVDDAVDWKLYDVQMSSEDLKNRILSGLRWGLFLRKGVKTFDGLRTCTFQPQDKNEMNPLVRINFHEIRSLQNEMESFGFQPCPIFSPKIDKKFFDTEIEVSFSDEDMESSVKEVRSTFRKTDTAKLLKCFNLFLTLPDAEDVFQITHEATASDRTVADMQVYDDWKWFIEKKYNSYLQIGGHGDWIQYNYTDTFIAQVNNDVGDCGSVFIVASPKGDFDSFVDMC